MLFHELNRANCKTYFLGCESTRQAALIDPVREQDDSVRFPPLSQLSQMAQLTPREIHAQIASPKPPLLVDVRQADEYSGELGHVPGSRSISLRELARRAEEIADHKTKDVVCICRAGMRSTTAAAVLRGLGFEHVWNMKGGMLDWNDAGLPVER